MLALKILAAVAVERQDQWSRHGRVPGCGAPRALGESNERLPHETIDLKLPRCGLLGDGEGREERGQQQGLRASLVEVGERSVHFSRTDARGLDSQV